MALTLCRCIFSTTHLSDIPCHVSVQFPLLLVGTPFRISVFLVLTDIMYSAEFRAIVAPGNAAVYLVAFLSTDNSTPRDIRNQIHLKLFCIHTEQRQTT